MRGLEWLDIFDIENKKDISDLFTILHILSVTLIFTLNAPGMSIEPVLNRLLRRVLGEPLAVSFRKDLGLSDAEK